MVGGSSAGIFPNRSAKLMMPLTKSWTAPEAFSVTRSGIEGFNDGVSCSVLWIEPWKASI